MSEARDDPVDLGRRSFLQGRLGQKRAAPLGPPAPALLATLALGESCAGCDAPCVAACEPDIIRLHPESHPLAGRPYLAFENGGCTFCQDCVKACPHGGESAVAAASLGLARIDRQGCVAWNGVICFTCQTACTYGAISTDGNNRPHVETGPCTGCGLCVGVCPVRAVRVEG